jgi:hypothetical protein
VVLFGDPPYLIRSNVMREPGHHRLVLTPQDNDARITYQV